MKIISTQMFALLGAMVQPMMLKRCNHGLRAMTQGIYPKLVVRYKDRKS